MFFTDAFSDQQVTTLIGVATFLTVAPLMIFTAGLIGYLSRNNELATRPAAPAAEPAGPLATVARGRAVAHAAEHAAKV